MKTIYTLLVATTLMFGFHTSLSAQENKGHRPHFTKEEFRTKQKEFIIKKAELTNEEAKKFFPLFFDLQDKKKRINDNVSERIHKTKKLNSQETDYKELNNRIINSRLECDRLDRCYMEQYRTFLSDKKIFKVLTAEMNFHKELLKNMRQEYNKKKNEVKH